MISFPGDFEFVSAEEVTPKLKCTVHKSGKMGFNTPAIEALHLKERGNLGALLACSKANPDPLHLYMVLTDRQDARAFKVVKAGEYYYVAAKAFFDHIKLDYKGYKTVIYDLTMEGEGESAYIEMKGRATLPRKATPKEEINMEEAVT